MTRPDFGPERPGEPSDTRTMAERQRTETGANISGRSTMIAFFVIVLAIAALVFLLR